MDRAACEKWVESYFHPGGLKCPHCKAPFEEGLWFRRTERSDLDVYRCRKCNGIYNLYSGTIFEGRYFTPEQTVLFIREVCQGKPTAKLARELGISRTTATVVRRLLQANAEREQATTPLDDLEVETDEMFQNAGEKKRLAWRPGRPTPTTSEQTARTRHLCQ
jgi:transposase-like protein